MVTVSIKGLKRLRVIVMAWVRVRVRVRARYGWHGM
jgi:hypothetical protein